jgi:putative ATP-dependent endonuclease of the OLD family
MKIAEVRIQNLRGYKDQTVTFNDYTCLVGPNGAGKSTVLCALCIFFRDTEHFVTDLHSLQAEDFHGLATDQPIRVTVTFTDLTPEAIEDFKEYHRQGKLVITAEAKYDLNTRSAEVRQYGQRMVMREFKPYFAADGDKKPVAYLKDIYQTIRGKFPDLPDVSVKAQMADALHTYENKHPDRCELFPSSDQFYGFSGGANRLAKYVQWVYIPAVKDASTEQTETKSSALGKLLARSVRSRINFSEKLAEIRREVSEKYIQLIADNQEVLSDLSTALGDRLREYAHFDTRIQVKWQSTPDRAIRVDEPIAQIVAGEGGFDGELARFGHGLQRCYVLALLQELSVNSNPTAPRLILGCDEPELHQHPPQARHLADVLVQLSGNNSQVVVSTHSPHLVFGDRFADIRLIRKDVRTRAATVSHVTVETLAHTIAEAKQEAPVIPSAATLRLRQALMPSLNEMFFTRVVVLVEGVEDVAFITTYATLLGRWSDFRRLGCHLIPTEGKSRMFHPLTIAKHLNIPTFALFDADTHTTNAGNRHKHEKDNGALLRLRGHPAQDPMPAAAFWSRDTVMWSTEIANVVEEDFGAEAEQVLQQTRVSYGQVGNLEKTTMFIADYVEAAWARGLRSKHLEQLIESIIAFAQQPWPEG